ncbi:MAG: hypothetical protein ACLGHN_09425, partial [Bacteriovoracia bacterium]
MNMKMMNYSVLILLTTAAFQVSANNGQRPEACLQLQTRSEEVMVKGDNETDEAFTARSNTRNTEIANLTRACNAAEGRVAAEARESEIIPTSGSLSERCKAGLQNWENVNPKPPQKPEDIIICEQLRDLSGVANTELANPLDNVSVAETVIVSVDGQIKCKATATFTMDYNACKRAVTLYDAVIMAEKAMDLQQKIRTDVKGANLHKEAQQKVAEGDVQGAALDGQMSMQKHMEGINKEKLFTYIAATGALMKAWWDIPGEKQVFQRCQEVAKEGPQVCAKTAKKPGILVNKDAKAKLQMANVAFAAKATAAQLAINQNKNNQKTIAKVKAPFETEGEDVMFERCQFNPADPACVDAGNRVRGGGVNFGSGNFDLGGGGSNNAFDLGSEGSEFGEVGAETNLDDKNEVASLNNPFADAAKDAKGILNPAGAAQVQASGGAGGGGAGGGAGGGLGGGGASLGSDLS